MSNSLFSDLNAFIRKYNFVVMENFYDKKVFGDAYLIISNDMLVLRFVLDRSEYFVDVKSVDSADKWHQLYKILCFLGVEVAVSTKLQDLESILDRNYDAVADLFLRSDRLRELRNFEKST